MRKKIIVLVSFSILLSGSSVFSNTFGIKCGANLSGFIYSDVRKADGSLERVFFPGRHKLGLSVGASYSIKIIQGFSIQPELFFSNKGGGSTSFRGASIVFIAEKMSYLEIPLLLKYELDNFSLMAGPYVGLLIHNENKVADHYGYFSEHTKDEMGRKSIDSGIVFGAGLTSGKATIEIRYAFGLINLLEISTLKNSTLTFLIGMNF